MLDRLSKRLGVDQHYTRLAASWHGMSPSNTLLRSCTAGCPIMTPVGRRGGQISSRKVIVGLTLPTRKPQRSRVLATPWPRLIRLEDAATPLAREIW